MSSERLREFWSHTRKELGGAPCVTQYRVDPRTTAFLPARSVRAPCAGSTWVQCLSAKPELRQCFTRAGGRWGSGSGHTPRGKRAAVRHGNGPARCAVDAGRRNRALLCECADVECLGRVNALHQGRWPTSRTIPHDRRPPRSEARVVAHREYEISSEAGVARAGPSRARCLDPQSASSG